VSRLINLFPRHFRSRYGAEVTALLAESDRPVRDRLGLIGQAIRSHLGEVTRPRKTLGLVAAALAVVSLIAFGYAWAELAGGLRDVPRHWWAVLPLFGLGAAGTLGIALRLTSPRS
jgi:hypothetical protein